MYRMRASFYARTTWPMRPLPVINPIVRRWEWAPKSAKRRRRLRSINGRKDLVRRWYPRDRGVWRLRCRIDRLRRVRVLSK